MTTWDAKQTVHGRTVKLNAEHRRQVELLRQLGERESGMLELLGNLYASYAKHFAYEEAVMRTQCNEGYEAHQADHQRLLDEITTAMFRYRSGAPQDDARIAKNLAASFRDHLINFDQPCGWRTTRASQVV